MNIPWRTEIKSQAVLHGWLFVAIGCAGVAGMLSVLVAAARISAVGWLLPNADMFYVAMVGHVSFGLIIWLLAFVVAITVYFGLRECWGYNVRWLQAALAGAMLGAGIVLGSVLSGQGETFLTDYVPVLETPMYFVGYAIFAVSIVVALACYLPTALRRRTDLSLPAFGMLMAVVGALIAAAALVAALVTLAPRAVADEWRYQSLFWGAGHALQYVYVTTMAVAWYTLARGAMGNVPISPSLSRAAFGLAPLLALPAPLAYFAFDATYWGNLRLPGIFLDAGLSLPTVVHMLVIAWAIGQAWRKRALPRWREILGKPEGAALFVSMGLFLVGAALEPRASLDTTRVPAHYHGMVVGGVTTALMGLSYHLLRQMNWQIVREQFARAQLYLFGVGVLISITGLAWAGSLGAPRKTFDAGTGSAYAGSMNFMGIGAALAALGGALFVYNILHALLRRRQAQTEVAIAPAALAE
ncbi:MAG: cbb3-type cytochrome c oxidase subunit I [Chloroflexi bacterium]|nr:cbb3-type cytochrome c oxidase subunit I [Chloroflexota bacterium]